MNRARLVTAGLMVAMTTAAMTVTGAVSGETPRGAYADTPVVRQLQALVGSQSNTDIAAIIDSGGLVQVLMDDTGTAIAAMYDETDAGRFLAG